MSKYKIYTPEGVQDILTEECKTKKHIEASIRETLNIWAYNEIETPSIEYYDVFSDDSDLTPQEMMFKFFDHNGRILVLRPDMTIPVARLAATKYKDTSWPLRFCYIGNTYRYNESGGGRQKEFTQAGAEILGEAGPKADAEVICTAIDCVLQAGLENFKIDIGQVEFFKGLMEQAGFDEDTSEKVRMFIEKKDYPGMNEVVRNIDMNEELKSIILNIPSYFGDLSLLGELLKRNLSAKCISALDNLKQIIEIINDYGYQRYVSIDLAMVQSLNYYTGVIFKGFTHGVGFPIISGGRYDSLVGKFGKDMPATGFSIGINLMMAALDKQNICVFEKKSRTLIGYEEGMRKTAFDIGMYFRNQNEEIEIDISGRNFDECCTYARDKGYGGVLYVLTDGNIKVFDARSNETKELSRQEICSKQ